MQTPIDLQNGVATVHEAWPNCSPDVMMSLFREFNEKSVNVLGDANSKRKFYSTYGSWNSLNEHQQSNVVAWFYKLPLSTQTAAINTGQKRSAEAALQNTDTTDESGGKQAQVMKDDLARLIELFIYPAAQIHITNALGTLNRRSLDARKSTMIPDLSGQGSLADDANPWGQLASIFMDYDNFAPQNRLIQYEQDENGNPTPLSVYQPADPDLSSVAARCHDLRPTNLSRRHIVRDDVWLKTQFLGIRTLISGILADFNRSGEMSDKSEADLVWMSPDHQQRWLWHCTAKKRRYAGVMS
jgi:hypothetical protein